MHIILELKSKKKMKYLIVFLLTITSYFALNEAENCGKNMVQFQNQLAQGVMLKVNCTSRDNNLRDHFVAFNGAPYEIKFDEAPFRNTRWLCTMQHGKSSKYFRAYQGSFYPRCGQTRGYIAKFDGIYLSKNGHPDTYKYNWDPLP